MTSQSEWIDTRLTVFLVWGVCVTVFLCYPSRHLIIGLFHRLGFPCCAHIEHVESPPSSGNEVDYKDLSNEKKHEIDSLRSIALLRHLSHFSMSIKSSDMVRPQSQSKVHFNEAHFSQAKNPQCKEKSCIELDVEIGSNCPCSNDAVDTPLHIEEQFPDIRKYDESSSGHTHVMIPCAGYSIGLLPIMTSKRARDEKGTNRRRVFDKKKIHRECQEPETDKGNDNKTEEQTVQHVETAKRDVSVHCAICLTEYEVSERISWSSNPECTHVFHEHCIVNWLIHLGRIKSKMQRYHQNTLTDAQLLNYTLDCPCCRQEFVWKEALAEGGDRSERV